MSEIEQIEGRLDGHGRRFAIVAARFNSRIVDLLVHGAVDCLVRHGVEPNDVSVIRVPGAWEIPLALETLALETVALKTVALKTVARVPHSVDPWDGLIALATVIRGETPHFDYVCSRCATGIARVEEKHGIPIGFGVLTCDDPDQAEERAGGKAGNKGWEAALAALEMADLIHRIRGDAHDG